MHTVEKWLAGIYHYGSKHSYTHELQISRVESGVQVWIYIGYLLQLVYTMPSRFFGAKHFSSYSFPPTSFFMVWGVQVWFYIDNLSQLLYTIPTRFLEQKKSAPIIISSQSFLHRWWKLHQLVGATFFSSYHLLPTSFIMVLMVMNSQQPGANFDGAYQTFRWWRFTCFFKRNLKLSEPNFVCPNLTTL